MSPHTKATLIQLTRGILSSDSHARVAVFGMGNHRHDPELVKLPSGRFSFYTSIPKHDVHQGTGLVFRTKDADKNGTNRRANGAVIYQRPVNAEMIKEVFLESCKDLPPPPRTAPEHEVLEFKATPVKKNGASKTEKYAGAERRIAQKAGLLAQKAKLVKKLEAINAELAEIAALENARAVLIAVAPKKQ